MKIHFLIVLVVLQSIFILVQFFNLKINFVDVINRLVGGHKFTVNRMISNNQLFRRLDVSYNNTEAMNYLKKSIEVNNRYFKKCNVNRAIDAFKAVDVGDVFDVDDQRYSDLIKIGDVKKSNNTFYMISINLDYIKTSFHVQPQNFYCWIINFDKKLNTREEVAYYGNKIKLNLKGKFTILTDKYGFYKLSCKRRDAEKREIFRPMFDGVFVVYPKNMNDLIQKTTPFFKKIDNMKKKFTDSKKNPFLEDGEFNGCDLPNANLTKKQKMNVLIIGLDSVSTNHFKRVFPSTYNYLTNKLKNNIFYENYNKIGENTYPNMVPFLSGVLVEPNVDLGNRREILHFRRLDTTYHDLLPFVWKMYQKIDYLTMYNEEHPKYGTFTYLKNGFRYWPANLYTTPFFKKYEKTLTGLLCSFNNPTYKTSLNLIQTFVEQMNKPENEDLPYFSYNFLKYYTHDFFSVPTNFDYEFKKMLRYFEMIGYLDNTLLILMSDHGSRLSEYSYQSPIGKMERSMPFLSVRLPKALWDTEYQKNAEENKKRLLTVLDINKTLKQFFYLNKYGIKSHVNSDECRENFRTSNSMIRYKRGVSLFEQLPLNRSCENALIPNNYCTAVEKVDISEEEFRKEARISFKDAAIIIVKNIVAMTSGVRSFCEVFKLRDIVSVKKSHTNVFKLYEFQVMLQPGPALFEANLMLRDERFDIYGKAIRLNVYGSQSDCLTDNFLHGFCYCKNRT